MNNTRKRIYKYATGDEIPEGSVFLSTIVEQKTARHLGVDIELARFVWHYFLVEIKEID